jgi:hypothetical protein
LAGGRQANASPANTEAVVKAVVTFSPRSEVAVPPENEGFGTTQPLRYWATRKLAKLAALDVAGDPVQRRVVAGAVAVSVAAPR